MRQGIKLSHKLYNSMYLIQLLVAHKSIFITSGCVLCASNFAACKCMYRSLAKKGPVSNIRPPPQFALISCKGLKFTLKSAHSLTLRGEDFKSLKTHRTSSYLKTSRVFDVLIHSSKPNSDSVGTTSIQLLASGVSALGQPRVVASTLPGSASRYPSRSRNCGRLLIAATQSY